MTTMPDAVVVHPLRAGRPLGGRVRVPGDKSVSHRAFLLAALADGPVAVRGAAPSADVAATVDCLRRLGATVDGAPTDAVVDGVVSEPTDVLDCGNSGTALRLLAGVCATVEGLSVLSGDASLRGRPMGRVTEPLRRMGARVDGRHGGRLAPLVVRGGGLSAIEHRSRVASAQVKSCVLLAGLAAEGTTTVTEPATSRDHTERMLAWLGADTGRDGAVVWVRPGTLRARPLRVPADPSSAAFWMVAAACVPGSQVELGDVCLNPTRTGAVDVLRLMGARVDGAADREWSGEPVGDLRVDAATLGHADVGGDLVVRAIDEVPVLAVAGAVGGGLSVRGAGELRVKESNRIAGVARLLSALGVGVTVRDDGFDVPGGATLRGGTVDSRGDHRIAMSAAVAALAARGPVKVTGFSAVATSYPSFLADLAELGGRWEPA